MSFAISTTYAVQTKKRRPYFVDWFVQNIRKLIYLFEFDPKPKLVKNLNCSKTKIALQLKLDMNITFDPKWVEC